MVRNFFGCLFFLMSISGISQEVWDLEKCIRYAMENNITIQQTALDQNLLAIDKKDARGNFMPSVNANTTHSWNVGLTQNITTGILENQTTQFTGVGLTVGVDIYNGLQNQNRMIRARLAQISGQYQLLRIQEDVALNVANSYLQILFAIENLKVQEEQLVNDKAQFKLTDELVNNGLLPRGDLLELKATVALSEQRVVQAENAVLMAKIGLAQLLQLPDFKNFNIVEESMEAEPNRLLQEDPNFIYQTAKEIRTEILQAKANLEVAERDLRIAKGAQQPRLQGFYAFNTRAAYFDRVVGTELDPINPTIPIGIVENTGQNVVRPNIRPIFGGPESVFNQFETNKGHSYGLQLNIPIFNGLSVRNQIQRSKVQLERSKMILSQEELTLEQNVFTAFTDARNALKAYEAAQNVLESRTEALRYAQERLNVGLMNMFEFQQSQNLYVAARSEVLRTKYDYIFRTKILEFFFGVPLFKS